MVTMTGLCSFVKGGHFFLGLLTLAMLFTGCSMTRVNEIEECISASACPCMNVSGSVLGKIKDDTTVTLYKAEGFDYESIIEEINKGHPERASIITADQSFSFFCLPEGRYLLSIPASSYDYSFGSPIPAESNRGNLRVDAILQGGNSQIMFSAFSIERIS